MEHNAHPHRQGGVWRVYKSLENQELLKFPSPPFEQSWPLA